MLKHILLALSLVVGLTAFAQAPHYSTESEQGHAPCYDTIKLFGIKTIQDMDRMFPTWVPVRGYDTVVVAEGYVFRGTDKYGTNNGPIISYEDLPLFHYTHDFCFNIIPDSGFQNLLGYQVFTGKETHFVEGMDREAKVGDTLKQHDLHVEWESGLGQNNEGNPCAELNRLGKSCGFSTVGHNRGDIIWNWPTTGDWVHLEGQWIWDRGHPPAEAEIHPLRFMAVRRALVNKITTPTGERFATRVDIYANGDGGAFNNNRLGQPDYVHLTKMSLRDYTFTVKSVLQKPSPAATLKYMVVNHAGHNFSAPIDYVLNNDGSCTVTIPWRTHIQSDIVVFAQTLYLYWDEGSGALPGTVSTLKIKVDKLKIRRRKEFLNKSEFRLFMDVGGQWIFVNDLFGTDTDILGKGLGKTHKRNFKINKEYVLYVPQGQEARVYVTGWEADGMDRSFGHIVNDHSPCDKQTKEMMIKSDAIDLKQVALHGCLDDFMGDAANWHKPGTAGISKQQLIPQKGRNIDVCPCSKWKLEKGFTLYYTVETVN